MREEEEGQGEESTMSVRSNLSSFYEILSSYNSNVLLAALVFLLLVVLFVLLLHFYARYFWSDQEFSISRRRRRRRRNRRRTSTRIIPSLPLEGPNGEASSAPGPATNDDKGLDSSVISKIPLFIYEEEKEEEEEADECVICLGLWEVGDFGRKLRNCGHGFHVECIDMWLSSHSTCPLCRSPVLALSDQDSLKKLALEEEEAEQEQQDTEVRLQLFQAEEDGEVRIEVFDEETNGEESSRSDRRSTSSASSSLMRMLSGRSRSERKKACPSTTTQDSSP